MPITPVRFGERLALARDESPLGTGVSREAPAPLDNEARARRVVRAVANPMPTLEQVSELDAGSIVRRSVPNGRLFVDGVRPFDITQGLTGDCWLVASLIAIAATRPELIENAVTDNEDGTFTVRLYEAGAARDVTVNGELYMHAAIRKPVYMRSRNATELWGPIIEKAYAGLHDDGYQGVHSGWPADALRTLTNLDSDLLAHASSSDDALYATIEQALRDRRPTVADIGIDDVAAAEAAGLLPLHAYAVLGTQIEDGQRYLVLRNTTDSPEFETSAYIAALPPFVQREDHGSPFGLDGAFRMRIDDYRRWFRQTTVLKAG